MDAAKGEEFLSRGRPAPRWVARSAHHGWELASDRPSAREAHAPEKKPMRPRSPCAREARAFRLGRPGFQTDYGAARLAAPLANDSRLAAQVRTSIDRVVLADGRSTFAIGSSGRPIRVSNCQRRSKRAVRRTPSRVLPQRGEGSIDDGVYVHRRAINDREIERRRVID